MAKQLANIMLILVLLITVVPVKQVGKALFNNQWTEELNDHDSEEKFENGKWTFTGDVIFCTAGVLCNPAVLLYAVFFQQLPSSPSCEIHYPPPDLHNNNFAAIAL